jgi:hypothetical protein
LAWLGARLVPYHAMLRERIENLGGTVEKFVSPRAA